ncbi:MAG TPA: hypothetical protein VFE36_00285 [Candidatus Baltobacteraceae bacterium]|jgi:hypothetical protein|nr:hypothetical protein [Candidatus Baltobacteraceae bacterium]
MRRFPIVEIAVVIFAIVIGIIGWQVDSYRYHLQPGVRAKSAPSELYARMTIQYAKPPIYEELYDMQDIEGVSTFSYRIRSYNCREITIKAPAAKITDVSFFFGGLDQDGIWQLVNKAPLPNATATYTVWVKQLADYKQGERTVTFTDPHYWAVTAGRQFHIDLSKQNPNDLLKMQSTVVADPRYEQIVRDFRQFGPDEFRNNVARAQARARSAKCPA